MTQMRARGGDGRSSAFPTVRFPAGARSFRTAARRLSGGMLGTSSKTSPEPPRLRQENVQKRQPQQHPHDQRKQSFHRGPFSDQTLRGAAPCGPPPPPRASGYLTGKPGTSAVGLSPSPSATWVRRVSARPTPLHSPLFIARSESLSDSGAPRLDGLEVATWRALVLLLGTTNPVDFPA